jgi:L-lysine 6-transaminase
MMMEIIENVYTPAFYVEPAKVISTLKKYLLADGYDLVLDLHNSEGHFFTEARTGKKYIDFFTFFASIPIGMNHPKLNNEEFIRHLGKIALTKPSNSDIYTSEMATFVKTFFKIAVPENFKYSFFISGGALAVENALKTAFDWKVRRNFRKGYQTEKGHKILHFEQAFHGRSGYTMSLTNTDPTKVKYFPKFEWPRVSNPKMIFPMNESNLELVIEAERKSIEQIKQAFIDNKDDIAAIIIEPIQGEGGDNHFRNEFFQELRNIADENEALLIFDEVQTGVGLTGTMWAHQQLGVTPDIMCFGKKMQICGIIVTDRIDNEPDNVFHQSSRINSTWGGNLVDMVRSTKYLEIIHEENLVNNSSKMGQIILNKLYDLQNEFKTLLNNARGRGLLASIDFIDIEKRKTFINQCFEDGVMILPCGERSVRFRPALDIQQCTIDMGFDVIKKIMEKIS